VSYDEDDPGVGYNPAQRPHRHPAGRTCAIRIGVAVALVWMLLRW
jgi:hypothetical protein